MCNLVNHVQNIVCLNEAPAFYDVNVLPMSFHKLRLAIKHGQALPAMISKEHGTEITDTQSQEFYMDHIKINVEENKPLAVGSKINVPYLFQMDKILSYKLKVFTIIRNPVYTIASWNKHSKNINEAYVLDHDFGAWPRYKDFNFQTSERFTRQAELLDFFLQIIIDHDLNMIKYEDLVEWPLKAIMGMAEMLGIPFVLKKEISELDNLNRDHRFLNIDLGAIRDAVNQHCPLGKRFYP